MVRYQKQRKIIIFRILLIVVVVLTFAGVRTSSLEAFAASTKCKNPSAYKFPRRCLESTSTKIQWKVNAAEYEKKNCTEKIRLPCEELNEDENPQTNQGQQEKVFATLGTLWSIMSGSVPAVVVASGRQRKMELSEV